VSCGLLILFNLYTRMLVFAIALVVFSIGNSIVLTSVNVRTQAISRIEHYVIAACMYRFMRSLGMLVSVIVGLFSMQDSLLLILLSC
jgi:hypothetical protein